MKRGDVIARDSIREVGTTVLHNASSEERAKAFMETDFLMEHNCIPAYDVKPDELNPGGLMVVLTQAVMKHEEAQVTWVIDGAAAIRYKDGRGRIFVLADETDWKVIVESVPSYQSSVEDMSDEQLRQAIDDLRAQRTFITSKPRRISIKRENVDKNDPLAVALASMPTDKKVELMRKLGMID